MLATVAGDVAADEIPDHKIKDGAPGTIPGAPSNFFNWYESARHGVVEHKTVLRELVLEASAVRCRNLGRDDFPRHVSQQGVSGPFISGAGR